MMTTRVFPSAVAAVIYRMVLVRAAVLLRCSLVLLLRFMSGVRYAYTAGRKGGEEGGTSFSLWKRVHRRALWMRFIMIIRLIIIIIKLLKY